MQSSTATATAVVTEPAHYRAFLEEAEAVFASTLLSDRERAAHLLCLLKCISPGRRKLWTSVEPKQRIDLTAATAADLRFVALITLHSMRTCLTGADLQGSDPRGRNCGPGDAGAP